MRNWFDGAHAADLYRRLDRLTPDARPRWGTFTAEAVVCHLADVARVALGEKTAATVRGPLTLPVVSHAVVWVLPWPKDAPTAPEFLPGKGMTRPDQFVRDKQSLIDVLRRFEQTPSGQAFADSPVFGRLSRRGWGRLMWRHVDHHLRQFGL